MPREGLTASKYWLFLALSLLIVSSTPIPAQEWTFSRGDFTDDGAASVLDALSLLNVLFVNGALPTCLDAGDYDDDGDLDVIDALGILTYVFAGGQEPLAPFPACGVDPTPDDGLSCLGPLDLCGPAEVAAPRDIAALAISETQIEVSWSDNSDIEIHFEIERAAVDSPDSFTLLATLKPDTTAFLDLGLEASTPYCYRVRAIGSFGSSDYSEATCTATLNPEPPSQVVATAVSQTEVDLSWQDNSAAETGFALERALGDPPGPFKFLAALGPDTTDYSDPGLAASTHYCYRLRAFGGNGSSPYSNTGCTTTWDPEPPSDLGALAVSQTQIDLTWRDNSATETAFELERSVDGPQSVFVSVALLAADTTFYSDNDLEASTEYCYRVRARAGTTGGSSDYSNSSCATTFDPPVPEPPSLLNATAISQTQIELAWQDNSEIELSFEIERSESGPQGPFVVVISLGPDSTDFSDADLLPATEYCYRVRALGEHGESDYSNDDCEPTFTPPPPQKPTTLLATTLAQNEIVITWLDNADNENSFELQRSESGVDGPYDPLAVCLANQEVFFDTSVMPNHQYCYRIRAVNVGGASAFSNSNCKSTFLNSVRHKVLFDTGVFEVSEDGPHYPTLHHGQKEFQTHVHLPDFDYTSPVNFVSGKVYQRMDVLNRPSLTTFCAQKQVQETGFDGDHWWPFKPEVTDPKVYTVSHLWLSMRDATGLHSRWNNPPALRMAFAVQCAGGDPNSPWNDTDIFPMYCRFTWVLVAGTQTFAGWEAIVGPDRPLMDPLGFPYATFSDPVTVTMTTDTHNGEIRYTLDGSEPTSVSTLYESPVDILSTTTIKAKTFKPGVPPSDTTEMIYDIDP